MPPNLESTWSGEPVHGIAFDLDGVLVDSFRIWFRVLNATLEELDRPPLSEAEFRLHWGQPIEQDIEDWFPGRTPGEVTRAYAKRFPEHLARVEVLPGARRTVEALARAETPRGVVTNSPRDMAEALLREAGMHGCFATIVTADDVPRSKPAPDMIRAAAGILDCSIERLLVIGDSRFDAEAARAAGAPFLAFREHNGLIEILRERGLALD